MAKKDMRIKALDEQGQPRVVTGYGSWKPWRSPAKWTDAEIAALGHRPGVYMLRAVTSPDKPVEFSVALGSGGSDATASDLAKRAGWLQGVLYIGKAVDLTSRFGMLVISWQTDPPTPGHTSAKNYLRKDAAFRQHFPASKVELTCKPIGSKNWTDKALADGLLGLSQKWFWKHYPHWTQGHGNSEMDQTCAATIDTERSLLCLYRMTFGDFPPLNRRKPNCIGARLDDAWLNALFTNGIDPAKLDPSADAAISMDDPDSQKVKDIIAKNRSK